MICLIWLTTLKLKASRCKDLLVAEVNLFYVCTLISLKISHSYFGKVKMVGKVKMGGGGPIL